jgi:hypothetical protein
MITSSIHIDVADLLALADPCPERDSGDQAQITTAHSRTVKGGSIAFYATAGQLHQIADHFRTLAASIDERMSVPA